MFPANFVLSVNLKVIVGLAQAFKVSESWYEATAWRDSPVALDGHHESDVCVIGAGLAGLTRALELARARRSVVVPEASRIAGGASGCNGGFVSNGFALGVSAVAARVGTDAAQRPYDLSPQGTSYVRNTIAQHDRTIISWAMVCGSVSAIRIEVGFTRPPGARCLRPLRTTRRARIRLADAT